jgi:tRNA (guanine10-N2)-dimethyltransferase
MKLLLLSKENIPLAKAEAEALLGKGKLFENILLINTKETTNRLAYAKLILNLIFEAKDSNIEQKIKATNWNGLIKDSFAFEFIEEKTTSQSLSRHYGGIIYDILKHPKVNLGNPTTKITALKMKNKIFVGIEEWRNNEKFFERRPSVRPGQQPITLSPKLARACINLTGSTTSIHDPFCGVGGFLIEAGLMKLKISGSDISNKMLNLCKENLKHYKIDKFKLFKEDALKIKKKYDYIVTDPPYGKGSRIVGRDLHLKFIKNLGKIFKKSAVIIFPSFIDAKKLVEENKLKVKGIYSVYIHKSLTRNIYLLEK